MTATFPTHVLSRVKSRHETARTQREESGSAIVRLLMAQGFAKPVRAIADADRKNREEHGK